MTLRFTPLKTTVAAAALLILTIPVSGCDLTENHLKIDRSTQSEVQDYRDMMAPRESEFAADETNSANADTPDLQAYVADDAQGLKSMPLVSIAINQTVPLRDALFELAKQADYDIQLDPRIRGSVIFTARNKPFDMVIDQICEIAGLRYKMDEGSLKVELDTPYTKTYKVDYISFIRKNKSSITSDVGISSAGSTSGAETGSNNTIETESENNFWAELDVNLKQILQSNGAINKLMTDSDPQITLTTSNPSLPPAPPIDEQALSDVGPQAGEEVMSFAQAVPAPAPAPAATTALPPPTANGSAPATVAPAPAPTGMAQDASQQPAAPQQTNLTVDALPVNDAAGSTSETTATPAYSINKQAGLVSVYASERLQKEVEDYLSDVRRATTSQVLIEAKVLEVQLTDEFSTGIDWESLGNSLGEFALGVNFPGPDLNPTAGSNLFTASYTGNDFTALIDALSRYGTVRGLASPRVTVINNNPAILSVAKNTVYFELDITSTTTGSPPVTDRTVDTEIKTVPEGVLINVLPSIDLDRNQVSMQVRPTVTRIDSFKEDPGATIASGGTLTSNIPEVNVQEIDSVVRLNSGQAMVMGGLLEDRTSSTQNGVPVLSEAPILGSLFRNQGDKVRKTELVIFLKATIVNDAGETIHNTDRELYKAFSKDRRPYKL